MQIAKHASITLAMTYFTNICNTHAHLMITYLYSFSTALDETASASSYSKLWRLVKFVGKLQWLDKIARLQRMDSDRLNLMQLGSSQNPGGTEEWRAKTNWYHVAVQPHELWAKLIQTQLCIFTNDGEHVSVWTKEHTNRHLRGG